MTPLLQYILVGLLGLVIGSFLNVLIYRVPRKVGFVSSRSACPNCGKRLRWYHNIPLLSYVILRGKCAFCSEHISWRYPIVEALNAGAYIFFLWQFGLGFEAMVYGFLTSLLLVIFFVDLDFQLIPDVFTLPGTVIGLGVSLLPGGLGIVQALLGLLVGGGSLYLIALLGDWLFKKESMGGGDIKMAAMLGAFLGWQKVLFIFLASACIGLVVSVVLLMLSEKLREERVVPFGPFLAVAAMLAITYGDQLIDFYRASVLGLH